MVKLFFYGTDKRSEYLKEMYEEQKANIQIVDSVEKAEIVITSIPFTKDGKYITGENILIEELINSCRNKIVITGGIKDAFKSKMEEENIKCVDLMELDEIAYLNAIPTAEGAIKCAMDSTPFTIHGANVLVLGFGRVGKILADKLKGLNANVFCEARSKKDLAHIQGLGYNVVELNNITEVIGDMDIIFSTIPAVILDKEKIKLLSKDTVIIDLASAPGSVDYEACEEYSIKAYLELGIPSKAAPLSAAGYLKQSIDNIIENEGDKNDSDTSNNFRNSTGDN